jgi:autotransporter-associated beta strand protein
LNTEFSGIIQDSGEGGGTGGSLYKKGTGTLTLSGANTYTGGTTLSAGTLLVNNTSGSGTGTNKVAVSGGSLGGTGTISSAVTVGNGSGAAAYLAPGDSGIGTLTVQNKLIFKADATYVCELGSDTATADNIAVNGIKIQGAAFSAIGLGSSTLAPGTILTVIDNTSAAPIAGTFSNLADGGSFTVGSNTYLASYSGGTGNDLTLTVQ